MQKGLVSIICTLGLLAIFMPAISAEESLNATANATLNETLNTTANIEVNATANIAANATSPGKVLRAGFEKTKPLNNLDVYGNKSTYNIPFSTSQGAPFEVNQRLGNVSQFTYKTQYKPLYNISQYSRNKPTYEIPASVSSKPTYSITSYPVIKAVNSIP